MKKLLLSSLLALVFAVPAHSQMMDSPMMQHMEGHEHGMAMGSMDRMGTMMGMCIKNADKIGLSEDQTKKITPIHREMEKSHLRFKAELKIAEMDLMEIMEVKDFDLEKAKAAVKKIEDLKTAHHQEMLKSMKDVRTIMTEEQFQKMKKLMPMMMEGKKPVKKMKK